MLRVELKQKLYEPQLGVLYADSSCSFSLCEKVPMPKTAFGVRGQRGLLKKAAPASASFSVNSGKLKLRVRLCVHMHAAHRWRGRT